ncbi:MAG: hypothetical protein KAS32_20695 [Candidatus Peribacteraceae bacterium]|nr:hypothetical protein [Candidatus Peribacteraceae bacterium]
MLIRIYSKTVSLLIEKAQAYEPATLPVSGFGIEAQSGTLTMDAIVMNAISVGVGTITAICTAIFIAGAFFIASSAGNDQRKSLGKDLMIGAVMGIAIVVAAKGIINIAYSFLYAP